MNRTWMRFSEEERCPLVLVSQDEMLCEIRFGTGALEGGEEADTEPVLLETARQLRLYFAGELRRFELPLALAGTSFQKRVWQALLTVPYGKTISYSELAEQIGSKGAVRAVGGANGKNPIPVVIPCHRVIGANGALTGFGGGLPLKNFSWLWSGHTHPGLIFRLN